ncbi:MAG: 4'-phosphopantetheinyl transferase superfamily protein [Alphaproteobacteria bacterium]|nr:4'-phosphopantetheinyl transferase superfamily protein [Alphaproteobacteria bacterium]MBU0796000.1 4'-phosphopantetheinyl transferase superfamily protein [Alphaproteobacteria bacterium]MBU1812477.1 4'-phosphopantetheinyl transferase superfamily protein [Alphaproteobacteria bacterium]
MLSSVRILGASLLSLRRETGNGQSWNRLWLQASFAMVVAGDGGPQDRAIDSLLHSAERELAAGFPSAARHDSFVLGRAAAKAALSLWPAMPAPQDVWIEPGVFGQPVIRGPRAMDNSLRISISHIPACAVAIAFDAAHPMGIDLESVTPDAVPDVMRAATPAECVLLDTLTDHTQTDHASILWSAQESLAKALGTGLMISPGLYEIDHMELIPDGRVVCSFTHFAQYKAICSRTAQGWCAIALPKNTFIASLPSYLAAPSRLSLTVRATAC